MLSPRLGLCVLFLLAVACTDDKKNDGPTPPSIVDEKKNEPLPPQAIDFDQTSSIAYAYGDYFNGYKSYQADLTNSTITGTWDQHDMSGLLRATATIPLSEGQREEIAILIKDLNRSMVTIEKSPCGYIADAPADSLHVTHKVTAAKIQIAEATSVEHICADEYVADKSLTAFFQFFDKILPQPEDPSAYKPRE